jgi:hypothetical protein
VEGRKVFPKRQSPALALSDAVFKHVVVGQAKRPALGTVIVASPVVLSEPAQHIPLGEGSKP